MFQNPCVLVEKEDGVEACGKGGIDVALDAIADHPACVRSELVAGDDGAIGCRVFFSDDFDGGEVRSETGAGELVGLLGLIAFGHEDEAVARGKVGQRFGDAGEQLDLLFGDGTGEAAHALDVVFRDRPGAETLIGGDKRAREAGEAVAVGEDGFALLGVQGIADFGGRVLVVVEIADEGGDGAFKIDVVFPEGIVGVDEQGLAGRELGHGINGIEPVWMKCNRRSPSAALRAGFRLAALAQDDNRFFDARDEGDLLSFVLSHPFRRKTGMELALGPIPTHHDHAVMNGAQLFRIH